MNAPVPAPADIAVSPPSLLAPLNNPAGGPMLTRLGQFITQEPVRRAVPLFLGVAALGGAALAWSSIAPSSQRILYSQINDSDRASVVAALDQSGIGYRIDNATGALTVDEADYYTARMLVAADGAVATPESGAQMLDNLPMGASRMLEGERLRAARERDLMLTIREIDGVESVRVHLAEGEKSVFVRDNVAPTASVMLRLTRGRQLSDTQVSAIVNLVAASVPGLSVDAVRVVDQHGRLLSQPDETNSDRLELQARMEEKLRAQVTQLLTPILGAGNFSTEIQVELDMDEVTSARETYDKDGAIRKESAESSTMPGSETGSGIPGALSNTPPPAAEAEQRPPAGTAPQDNQASAPGQESRSTRTYELGREVSVANTAPGGLKRLSVAVALSKDAMKGTKPADLEQIKQLVSAAVGANLDRGDQVAVMARKFEPLTVEETPFYEAPWFATVVRYAAAVLALILVLLLGVRPMIKALKRNNPENAGEHSEDAGPYLGQEAMAARNAAGMVERELLDEKLTLARRLVAEKPDSAITALRQMLNDEGNREPERATA